MVNWRALGAEWLFCAAVLSAAQSGEVGPRQPAAGDDQRPTAVVFTFAALPGQAPGTASISAQACREQAGTVDFGRHASTAPAESTLVIDPHIPHAISAGLRERLSKRMSVMVDPDASAIPAGSLVIGGCLFEAVKGSAALRLVGLGLGASRLSAHVVVVTKTEAGFDPADSLDVRVKGRSLLPPAPMAVAVRAARAPTQTLSGGAKKLAGQIAKRVENARKQQGKLGKVS